MRENPEFRTRLRRVLDQSRTLANSRIDSEDYTLQHDAFNDDINWLEDLTVPPPEPANLNVLQEADRLTSGDRRQAYSHPSIDFACTALLMDAVLARSGYSPGTGMDTELVPLLMMCVKLSRLSGRFDHRDSLVDIAGYARTMEMVLKQSEEDNS